MFFQTESSARQDREQKEHKLRMEILHEHLRTIKRKQQKETTEEYEEGHNIPESELAHDNV